MDIKDIRELTNEELNNKEQEVKKELFHLRVQQVSGKVENPSRIRQLKRMIARLKTVSREKQMAPEPVSKGNVA